MFSRRDVLRTGAALVSAAGIAGTAAAATRDSGVGRLSSGHLPEYANWVAADEAVPDTGFTGVETASTAAVLEYGGGGPPADPMLANPASVAELADLAWQWPTSVSLGDQVLGPAAGGGSADPSAVPVDRTVTVLPASKAADDIVYVFLGSFDTGAIRSTVEEDFYTEAADGVYEHNSQGAMVGWTEGAVSIGFRADLVGVTLDAGRGAVTRRHAASDDFAWLLETAGGADLTLTEFGEGLSFTGTGGGGNADLNTDFTMFQDALGYAHSAVTDGGAITRATAATVYGSADAVRRERLTGSLGTEADDRRVEQDGARVSITATYDGSQLGSTPTPTPASGVTPTPTATPTPTPEPTTTDGGSGPGMGVLASLAGLAGGASLLGRRSGGDESE